MENVTKLLDAVKAATGAKSDNALAARLGVRRQRISDYYKGERYPDNDVCLKIAQAINQPLNAVIAQVGIDTAKDETTKKAWKDYFKRIGGYAASLLMGTIVACTFIVHDYAQAATNQAVTVANGSQYKLCAFAVDEPPGKWRL